MKTQQRILKFVVYSNWLLLAVAGVVGISRFSLEVALGLIAGGLIVTINFHLLAKTLKKSLTPPNTASVKSVLIKYYIRFIITAIIIYFLMAFKLVNPFGLIIGLSIVVASFFFATFNEIRQLIFKEAS